MRTRILAMAAALALAACGGASREPSEAQMRGAVEAKFAEANANFAATAQACRSGAYQNDPMLAMQCLTLCGASGGESCDLSFEITRFEKIACVPGSDQPGFVCDYEVGFATNSPFVSGSMAALMNANGPSQGRFLRQDDGKWLMLPLHQ